MISGDCPRGDHADLSLTQVSDRLAIRELVDAYAYRADCRDAAGQMALFTEDTEYLVYADRRDRMPTQHFRGRAALAPVFDDLNIYEATLHLNGQSTVVLDGARASGVSHCLAHLVKADGAARTVTIAAIRYLDTFTKDGGTWFFSQRKAMVDWTATRQLTINEANRSA
jgi:hypothetical protein